MPFCTNCGQNISEGAKFCDRCGQPQSGVTAPTTFGAPAAATTVNANPPAYTNQPVYANQAGAFNSGFSANAQMPVFQDFARKMRNRGWIFFGIVAGLALIAILIFVREELVAALAVWAVVAAFTALLSLISNSRVKKSWEGQLIDKKIVVKQEHDNDDNSSVTRYRRIPTLFFQTTSGKKVKLELGSQQGAYDYYEPGCIVRKHSGFHFPEKRDKDAQIICVNCGKFFDRQLNACPKCKLIALK